MLTIGDVSVESRFLLGTSQYPSPETLKAAITAAKPQILTVSLRRQAPESGENPFWALLKSFNCHILPNTAGCFSANDAILTARMARELFGTHWIKLEVIGDEYTLLPDPIELIKAAEVLIAEGFEVFPYCTDDVNCARALVNVGCRILMPLASPIGSGKGVLNPYALQLLRERFADQTIIVDAGIGKPSHAAQVMEYGMDGVLLNTAVANSPDPINMAQAFAHAIVAGRKAYKAGMIPSDLWQK